MTELPNADGESTAEQADAGLAPPTDASAAAGENAPPPAAAERPARRERPVEVAVEVLTERGEETAAILASVLGSLAVQTGGRDDLPWAVVEAANLHEAASRCRDGEGLRTDLLHCMLAVDYVERIQMVYVLYSLLTDRKAILKVDLPAEAPTVDTVTDLWIAAGWYERETHDLFGVEFTGNPDLSPLLLYEGFEGHPGLKSYPLHDYAEW